jgi:cytochrome c peroxidase
MKSWRGVAWIAAPFVLIAAAEFRPPATADGFKVPLGLLPIQWPRDNPYSAAKWELGRALYYDPRLSADGSLSCATCHNPAMAFTDNLPVSTGIRGQKGGRSAPTVINRAFSLAQFWDGRAGTLEEQALGPMANPIEMGHTHPAIVETLSAIPGYRTLFKNAFGADAITIERAGKAIATFERTVLSGNSAYDRYKAGNRKALTPVQIRGFRIFTDKAKCDQCHEGVNFTTNEYHNLGVGLEKASLEKLADEGRFVVTHKAEDWGAFKTPTLRDVARTAPYMHDGSLKTLDEVIEFYDKGGIANKNLDEKLKPLHLTADDKHALVEFMKALNGEGWQQMIAPPELPK